MKATDEQIEEVIKKADELRESNTLGTADNDYLENVTDVLEWVMNPEGRDNPLMDY